MSVKMPNVEIDSPIRAAVLHWYGENARQLPWRIGPRARGKKKPDPYAVWLSEIMLQQTTVATVRLRYEEFLRRWPTVEAMAAAHQEDILAAWAGLGYYARARNLHKCAKKISSEFGGKFPDTEEDLKDLPGIGEYTASAIAAIAFDRSAAVVDGNIERIISRLFAIEEPLPTAKKTIKNHARNLWPAKRSGDFAQALMDIGALICRPKKPKCPECPLNSHCAANAGGAAEMYPVKPPKKEKPVRRGVAFALVNSKGEVLFERRREKGLLGGMLGLPGSSWDENVACIDAKPPINADWQARGEISHTFTHFHLLLEVKTADAPSKFRLRQHQQWLSPYEAALPTVMKKAVELAHNPPLG